MLWSFQPSSKYVTKTQSKKIVQKCETFLTWLREAEEEDDDEEESDDVIKVSRVLSLDLLTIFNLGFEVR